MVGSLLISLSLQVQGILPICLDRVRGGRGDHVAQDCFSTSTSVDNQSAEDLTGSALSCPKES